MRAGPEHDHFGRPFVSSAQLVKIDDDVIAIRAFAGAMLPASDYRELKRQLREHGFKTIRREVRDDEGRLVRIIDRPL